MSSTTAKPAPLFVANGSLTFDKLIEALEEGRSRPDRKIMKGIDSTAFRVNRLNALIAEAQEDKESMAIGDWARPMAVQHWLESLPLFSMHSIVSGGEQPTKAGFWLFSELLAEALNDPTSVDDFAVLQQSLGFNHSVREVSFDGHRILIPNLETVQPFIGTVVYNVTPVLMMDLMPGYEEYKNSVVLRDIEALVPLGLVLSGIRVPLAHTTAESAA